MIQETTIKVRIGNPESITMSPSSAKRTIEIVSIPFSLDHIDLFAMLEGYFDFNLYTAQDISKFLRKAQEQDIDSGTLQREVKSLKITETADRYILELIVGLIGDEGTAAASHARDRRLFWAFRSNLQPQAFDMEGNVVQGPAAFNMHCKKDARL